MSASPVKPIQFATLHGKQVSPDPRNDRSQRERQLRTAFRLMPEPVQRVSVRLFVGLAAAGDR